MNPEDELQRTTENLICPGNGIVAADGSLSTIRKRFFSLGIENTDETRRAYRSASSEQVAKATVTVLPRCVPSAVPSIKILSGGQGAIEATANLNGRNVHFANLPWALSFSYGRALQDPAMLAWGGHIGNVVAAQESVVHRARMNVLARSGRWNREAEHESSPERLNKVDQTPKVTTVPRPAD